MVHQPLAGITVVELAGIGPGPHAAMLLSDLGATVYRVRRPGEAEGGRTHTKRGRRQIVADLKSAEGREEVLGLVAEADVLIEGYRPGVAERLGVGPRECLQRNPRLVYARMTGWGQEGPLALSAGHDINYISITGALAAIGTKAAPVPPLNLVGDYAGGSLYLVVGVLAALHERHASGAGQVIDAAIVDGTANLMQAIWESRSSSAWTEQRASNLLDGGAPYYRTYECSDGLHVAVGPLEPQFYALMIEGLGLDLDALPDRRDRASWPALAQTIGAVFRTRTRDQWAEVFAGTDACVTPVLTMGEAVDHPHIRARGVLSGAGRAVEAESAPRFRPPP